VAGLDHLRGQLTTERPTKHRALALSWPLLCLLAAGAGCGDRASATARPADPAPADSAVRLPTHIDSILPIEQEIRRFRATLDHEPTVLGKAAARTRDELIRRYIQALEQSDTAAAAALMISRAEFGTLYYEHTRYTRPPYRMSPALLWFFTVQNSEKGLTRALATYGGSGIRLAGYTCEAAPLIEGPNRIWQDCPLRLARRDGAILEIRLFAGILERGGRFKFVSLANDF